MKPYPYKHCELESSHKQQELLDILSEKVEFDNSYDSGTDETRLDFRIRTIKGFYGDSLSRISGSVRRNSDKSLVSLTICWKPHIALIHYVFFFFAFFLAVGNIRNTVRNWEDWLFPVIYLTVVIISTVNFYYEAGATCNEIRKLLEDLETPGHKKTSRSGG